MPETRAEIQQLHRILESRCFAHTERLSRLLRYIVERTLEGHAAEIKEYTLGLEVFDKGRSYDPRRDPIVRVEASRLRAKLEQYYTTEGSADPIRIDLPRGAYIPIFREREPAPPRWQIRSRHLAMAAAVLVFAALAVPLALLTRRNLALEKQLAAARQPAGGGELGRIWGSFLRTGARNQVVFGSPLFFGSARKDFLVRFVRVNDASTFLTNPDFRNMQSRFGPLTAPRIPYVELGDAIAIQKLTAFLSGPGAGLQAVPAHLANMELGRSDNVILLGSPRMNPLLAKVAGGLDFRWGPGQRVYNSRPRAGESAEYATASHGESLTYAMVASMQGERPGQRILVVNAHSTPGMLGAIDYLTNRESLRALNERLKGEPADFELLLRIQVHNNLPLQTEYVSHHAVNRTPPAVATEVPLVTTAYHAPVTATSR